MNFLKYLKDAYDMTTRYPLHMLLGGLLVQLLSKLTLELLTGPLYGGYMLMIIRYLRDDREPVFSDIYSGFKRLGALFPFFVVMLIVYIGLFLLIIPALIFITWWIYTLPLMADRELRLGQAMQLSLQRVNRRGFFKHIIFTLLFFIIPIVIFKTLIPLFPPLVVLLLLLPPLQAGCVASLYLESFPKDEVIIAGKIDESDDSKPPTPAEDSSQPEQPATPAETPPKEQKFIPGE